MEDTPAQKQYREHDGNVLHKTVTEKDMIIMGLPNAREIFGQHEFTRETKQALYDPKLVLDMVFRGTKLSGFELPQEKIDSIIKTLRKIHNNNPELERIIQQYNQRVALFSEQEIKKSVDGTPIENKDMAQYRLQKDQKEHEEVIKCE